MRDLYLDGVVQHERQSYIDSIDVLDLPRGRLCLHGSLESQNNHCRNVAHAALSRPFVDVECKPISSTLIRTHLLKSRESLCQSEKGGGWKLKKNVRSENREKNRFRKGVENMLHPNAVEYLIEHITELWIVPKMNMVGGGQPISVDSNESHDTENGCLVQ